MVKNSFPKNSLLKFRERKSSIGNASSTSGQSTDQPKKFLRNTTLNQIINEIIIGFCQKLMDFNLRKRLIYYLVLIAFGSILCDGAPGLIKALVPYKTEKGHFLNQYFVKLGWFWTLVLLIPFQALTRKSIENRDKWYDLRDVIRVCLITLSWYFSVNSFNYIESSTAKCSQLSIKSRSACLNKGWSWYGFDISGHTFILLFSNLVLIEESKVIAGFENLGYLLDSRWQEQRRLNKEFKHYDLYLKLLVPIRVLFISITFLSLLWEFMLIQTVLHYHNFLQKMIAFVWSLGCWYVCYRIILPSNLLNLLSMPLKTPTELAES